MSPFRLPPSGTEDADEKMVMPGDNVELDGELVHDIALEEGSRFTLVKVVRPSVRYRYPNPGLRSQLKKRMRKHDIDAAELPDLPANRPLCTIIHLVRTHFFRTLIQLLSPRLLDVLHSALVLLLFLL